MKLLIWKHKELFIYGRTIPWAIAEIMLVMAKFGVSVIVFCYYAVSFCVSLGHMTLNIAATKLNLVTLKFVLKAKPFYLLV